jgi:hypothetical protein
MGKDIVLTHPVGDIFLRVYHQPTEPAFLPFLAPSTNRLVGHKASLVSFENSLTHEIFSDVAQQMQVQDAFIIVVLPGTIY